MRHLIHGNLEAVIEHRNASAMATLGRKLLSIVAESGITPNEITIIGLLLVLANCAAYLWHRDAYRLGGGLAIAFAFDSLDGAVARLQHSQSAYGSYLDAV